jgi:transcriptional regulator with XRE-family HTH domain
MMENSFNQRFTEILEHFKLNSYELARLTGVSRQNIDSICKGKTSRIDTLFPILKYFKDINMRWLLLGEGTMFEQPREPLTNRVSEKESEYTLNSSTIERLWMEDRKELTRLRDLNHELNEEISALRNETKKKDVG